MSDFDVEGGCTSALGGESAVTAVASRVERTNRVARALMAHNAPGETFRDDHEGWPEQSYRAEARVALAALGADTAWVIEKAESSPSFPSYWAGWGWSINHSDAIRYARKVDAENTRASAIDEAELGTDPNRHRVCEHSWDAA